MASSGDYFHTMELAEKHMDYALKGFGILKQEPEDYLKIATSLSLVGILQALSDIAYQIRNDNCDSAMVNALQRIEEQLDPIVDDTFAAKMTDRDEQ